MSTDLNTLTLGEEYITQVRTFGALAYTPERICKLLQLNPRDSIALQYRISQPGDTYHTAYHNGVALGEYNIDAELAKNAEAGDTDSIEMLEARKTERLEKDLRKELFGI